MFRISILTLLLFFYCFVAKAQVITGQVFLAGTDSVIAGASVYYYGMQGVVVSDGEGRFQLPFSSVDKKPLIVSAVGFYSVTTDDYSSETTLKIYLKPKIKTLQGITLVADGMSRSEKEKLFKREFIGTSAFASKCEITNLEDVVLAYSKKTKTLTAFCDRPIRIRNDALGYMINYSLDTFMKSDERLMFLGNYFFEEIVPTDKKSAAKTVKARKTAYYGSRMHFIRSLWLNRLEGEGYYIYTKNYTPMTAGSIVVENGTEKYIHFQDEIRIIYTTKNERSIIFKGQESTYISKKGFYETSGFQWAGFMAGQRVSDLLPFEYEPGDD